MIGHRERIAISKAVGRESRPVLSGYTIESAMEYDAFGGMSANMAPVRPQERYLEVNNIRLHYLDWGGVGNQPMLLLHGLMGHAHVWDAFAAMFGERYHVIALDQRGHGDSQWSARGAYSVDDHFSDIAGFVEALDLGALVLIGHSMGGRNALLYAACFPERVHSLIMMDSRLRDNPDSRRALKQLLTAFPLETDSLHHVVKAIQRLYSYVPDETAHHIADHGYTRLEPGRYVPKFDTRIIKQARKAHHRSEDMRPFLQTVLCPVLVVRGAESEFLSREEAAQIQRALPSGHFREIPRSTHMPVQENPGYLRSVVSDFLTSCSQSGT